MKVLELLSEVSLGNYIQKAGKSKALAQMGAAFAPSQEEREKNLAIAKRRERGLARAKPRSDKARAAADAKNRADALERDRERKPEMLAQLKDLEAQFDPNFEYSDDYSFWSKQKGIQGQIAGLKRRLSQLDEDPSVGTTSSANIASIANPKAAYSKGTKQPKNKDGTAVNALDMNANLFGSSNASSTIKRR